MSTAFHPRTDGASEVANKQLIQKIRTMAIDGDTNWLEKLPSIQATLNRAYDTSRRCAPFEMIYGLAPKIGKELGRKVIITTDMPARVQHIINARNTGRNNLSKSRLRQTKETNKRRRPAPVYNIGDRVMLSTRNLPLSTSHAKTAPIWIGPLKILNRRLETNNYTLELPQDYK